MTINTTGGSMQQSQERIQQLWARLQTTAAFSYVSAPGPRSQTGWHGEGRGRVSVEIISDDELHFVEQGTFQLQGGQSIDMHNRFIWQKRAGAIALSHGRRGERVFLFELVPTTEKNWSSAQDHVCINDLYSGDLSENDTGFSLTWHITGPKKDEHLFYQYGADNS
ncbi:DUF6314 family protein [Thalassolituus sp. LLYu03]|uniref:DUF6314 family protein n=1 Tax=Thalassolituus sp. LLYu03 TaxID=3421656 RepID=UPI003D2D66BD